MPTSNTKTPTRPLTSDLHPPKRAQMSLDQNQTPAGTFMEAQRRHDYNTGSEITLDRQPTNGSFVIKQEEIQKRLPIFQNQSLKETKVKENTLHRLFSLHMKLNRRKKNLPDRTLGS